jgi:hypothetical protein
MHDGITGGSDGRCRCCGRVDGSAADRTGRGCAVVMIALLGFIACMPLLWLARVAAVWAMGL